MKRFKLKILLLIIGVAACAAASALLFAGGEIPQAIILILILIPLAYGIFHMLGKLTGMMSAFVRGLEMNDTTMRFEADGSDRALSEMAHSMNRISSIYCSGKMELETRKLYYDRILRVMTHEMRNAITPVTALSSDMLEHEERYGDAEKREAIEVIHSQSAGITRFLESYHRLTHLPQPQKQEVSAAEFLSRVRQTVGFIEKDTGATDDIIEYFTAEGAVLNIDEDMMNQAVTNLLKNAVEATTIKNKDYGHKPEVKVTVTTSENESCIIIEDNGPGLSPELATNPFQPFFSTKPDGNGIGMFLSRQTVRLHGGEIRLHNNPGKGLHIRISLPRKI